MSRKVRVSAAIAAIIGLFGTGLVTGAGVNAAPAPVGSGFVVTAGDISFILEQIKISERHAQAFEGTGDPGFTLPANPDVAHDPQYCSSLVGPGPNQIPNYLTSYGLRTTDGGCNNLVPSALLNPDDSPVINTNNATANGGNLAVQKYASAQADLPFPRMAPAVFRRAEDSPPNFFGLGEGVTPENGGYQQKLSGNLVFDTQPRVISNLIVDQTSTNPAAVHAAGFPVRTQGNPGIVVCTTPPTLNPPITGAPVPCTPEHKTLFIPNVTTDVGLSPPYNSLFTFFGQFFDHGVDQTVKSGGTVFVPLNADDPLRTLGPDGIAGTNCGDPNLALNCDEVPANKAFMMLTRGQNQPGADNILGTADDVQDANNTDTPWVDQSQTYTSHSAHQAWLREYELQPVGPGGTNVPVATGRLLGGIVNDDPPCADSSLCYNDGNATTGSISTWAATRKQAAQMLGLLLQDKDVTKIPMLATGPYGEFIRGPLRGLPQYVTASGLVEGDLANPVPVPADVKYFDTPFLTDIAHNADPSPVNGVPPTPDLDSSTLNDFAAQPAGTYDDELLNDHFTCGDGRCNENIALTTIHQVFHHEHDRLVGDISTTLGQPVNSALNADFNATNCAVGCATADLTQPITFTVGERLFQAARFVTEMEYQHLVFEEFARKVQPAVRLFHLYTPDLNPAIPAEFAAAVYRFGHSMLDDDVARTNQAGGDNSLPLLTAFLNPPEFFNDHGTVLTPEQGAGQVVMGSSDQVGNELDEFVTETLRNNLLGLPLDLPVLNMTRARSEGIPPLNVFRRTVFARTGDGQLTPYTSWADYGQHLKHPESLINFIAAYGTHPSITGAVTLADKRAAATLIVNTMDTVADSFNYMNSSGIYASAADGVTTTGLESVDMWVGGLAEITNLFGGLLGSTFNYVFQTSLENLQDGDRFYYLARTPGMNLRTQLEGNSFSELIERNTDGTNTLKADAFATADCKFQVGHLEGTPAGFAAHLATVANDPATDCDESLLLLRKPDGTIQYRQINAVDPPGINGQSVYNGTMDDTTTGVDEGLTADRIFGGNDNDTFWGNGGNDIIEGNGGDDFTLGGDGNDIETDLSGADVQKGGPGNDALDGGIGDDIFMGGDGQDFIEGGANDNESFAGPGTDFINAGAGADAAFGDSGDDWIQGGSGQDLLIGDHSAPFFDDPAEAAPGNDVFVGQVGENDYDAEGGDDLMAQNAAVDRNAGAGGFDWAFHQYNTVPALDDMEINNNLVGVPIQIVVNRDRWQETEANSGSNFNDDIKGTSVAPGGIGGAGFTGCNALDQAGIDRIAGLDQLVTPAMLAASPFTAASVAALSASGRCPLADGPVWGDGDILIGGGGSDTLEGRGANDILDGDRALTVRIIVRDTAGAEIGSTDLMEHAALSGTFGLGTTPTMTLQQAVFKGLVDPGNLAIGRQIQSAGLAGDIDTARYTGLPGNYTWAPGPNGSTIVTDSTAVRGDGVDTLYNIEKLVFCDVPGATRGTCITPSAPVFLVPAITATPATSAFANQIVGTTSALKVITVTNAGTGSVTVSAVNVTGANPGSFAAVNGCTSPLAPAATCTINVTFTPTAAVAQSATISIVNSGAGSPTLVAVSGTGTAQTAPTAPTIGAATAADASATVRWTAPASNGGSAITSFSVQAFDAATSAPIGAPQSAPGAGATSLAFTGLANGTAVKFKVSAINGVGTGAASAFSNNVTPTAALTVPSAPIIGTATAGDASATVNWSPPANSGGSANTGFTVRVLNAANAQVGLLRPAPAGSTSLLVTGLANGTTYHFTVTASNATGTSLASASSNAVTPSAPAAITVPGAPTILAATRGTNGNPITATANWTPGTTGGSPITGYQVFAQVMDRKGGNAVAVGAPILALVGPTARAVTFTFTDPALFVRFFVQAVNAIGTGAPSANSNIVVPR